MKTEIKVKDSGTPIPSASADPIPTNTPKSDSIRDTLESIVVAFIMAFVFRAFIVEAFIIPTGSMASSLYGQHGQHRCAMCGYTFAYGIRDEIPRIQRATLADPFSVRCPNCGWDGEGNNRLNHLPDDPVVANAGDRILVLKWPYDLGGDLLGPDRWDVVVFKDPQDGHTNFIKRLIGLPGEVLEIINGDIYTAPAGSVRPDILESLSHPPPASPNLRKLSSEQSKALAKVLKIHRKTPVAQSSLWMIHYDHDYIPRSRHGRSGIFYDPPYWAENEIKGTTTAWKATTPKVTFTPAPGDDQIHWLLLRGKPIQDDYGYNSVNYSQIQRDRSCNVGDVRLKFILFPGANLGDIFISLSKGKDQFTARLQGDGTAQLSRLGDGGIQIRLKETQLPPLKQGDPLNIEFENLDYRVALRVDGQEVLWTDEDQYHPDVARLLEEPVIDGRNSKASVAIGAKGGSCQLRHIRVDRDVFYRSPRIPDRGTLLENYPGWGTATNPIYLRTDPPDYFCCGDNSPQSKDGRLWIDVSRMLMDRKNYQYGTVPGDQLIGRAFFVYWPNGLSFSKEMPRIIPNVGRMRFIR